MEIDVDRLRRDLTEENLGAFFVGGFGGAVVENTKIEQMSELELIEFAINKGVNLQKYCK